MNIINDVIKFLTKFWTIVWAWIKETGQRHKFTNVTVPLITIGAMLLLRGKFWDIVGISVIIFWLGMNTQGLISVFKKLKAKNNW